MTIFEQMFRTAFAIVTALFAYQIYTHTDPSLNYFLGTEASLASNVVMIILVIIDAIIIWPLFFEND